MTEFHLQPRISLSYIHRRGWGSFPLSLSEALNFVYTVPSFLDSEIFFRSTSSGQTESLVKHLRIPRCC